jgi:putative hydrolase of the HAD superfamily
VRFRAVFFDAGETLVHPAPSFSELFSVVLAGAGHDRTPEDVVRASSVVVGRFSEAARDRELWTTAPDRSRRFWADVYGRMLTALEVPDGNGLQTTLHDAFTDLSNYQLFDDVRPVLRDLAETGLLLGVVSNFEPWLDDLFGALGVRDEFSVRVISGVEGVEKPDPRIYELALERAGVAADEAAFVGDNPEFDVDPPASLGMFPVLVDRRGRYPSHAGTRVTSLAELPGLLETVG